MPHSSVLQLLLLKSGDGNHNTGPAGQKRSYIPQHPCVHFGKGVTARTRPISCYRSVANCNDLPDLFSEKLVDIIFISEITLDSTSNQRQFYVAGFKYFRKDRNSVGFRVLEQTFPTSTLFKGSLPSIGRRRRSEIVSALVV